jgi:tetratricopeptide (TPR) repeat protein
VPALVPRLRTRWLTLLISTTSMVVAGSLVPAGAAQSGPPSKAQEEAVSKAQAALESAKTGAEKSAAAVELGRAYYDEGEEKKAEDEYHSALDLDASNAAAHLELGRLDWGQHRLDQAQAEFQEVIRLAPRAGFSPRPVIWARRALCFKKPSVSMTGTGPAAINWR